MSNPFLTNKQDLPGPCINMAALNQLTDSAEHQTHLESLFCFARLGLPIEGSGSELPPVQLLDAAEKPISLTACLLLVAKIAAKNECESTLHMVLKSLIRMDDPQTMLQFLLQCIRQGSMKALASCLECSTNNLHLLLFRPTLLAQAVLEYLSDDNPPSLEKQDNLVNLLDILDEMAKKHHVKSKVKAMAYAAIYIAACPFAISLEKEDMRTTMGMLKRAYIADENTLLLYMLQNHAYALIIEYLDARYRFRDDVDSDRYAFLPAEKNLQQLIHQERKNEEMLGIPLRSIDHFLSNLVRISPKEIKDVLCARIESGYGKYFLDSQFNPNSQEPTQCPSLYAMPQPDAAVLDESVEWQLITKMNNAGTRAVLSSPGAPQLAQVVYTAYTYAGISFLKSSMMTLIERGTLREFQYYFGIINSGELTHTHAPVVVLMNPHARQSFNRAFLKAFTKMMDSIKEQQVSQDHLYDLFKYIHILVDHIRDQSAYADLYVDLERVVLKATSQEHWGYIYDCWSCNTISKMDILVQNREYDLLAQILKNPNRAWNKLGLEFRTCNFEVLVQQLDDDSHPQHASACSVWEAWKEGLSMQQQDKLMQRRESVSSSLALSQDARAHLPQFNQSNASGSPRAPEQAHSPANEPRSQYSSMLV